MLNIKENVSLKDLTTFKIGGLARFFTEAKTEEEVIEALTFAEEKNVPTYVLGDGSNVLVSDKGFPGLVLAVAIKGLRTIEKEKTVTAIVGAGNEWDGFVDFCVRKDWAGIECLSGIPGKIGGAPVQNIGAYGQSVHETITEVKVIEIKTRTPKVLKNDDCGFSYRKSIFNTTEKGKYIVTSVTFHLKPHSEPTVTYQDLINWFVDPIKNPRGKKPTLEKVRQATLEIRSGKGLLKGNYQNAGSFFKNVIIREDQFKKIEEIVLREKEGKPGCCGGKWNWEEKDGKRKIATACLVHCAGFAPGTRDGKVGTSPKQTLAVTNFDDASAEEVMQFVEKIRSTVKSKFGVQIEIEPELVGFE
ncbi:MAG: UDP-N-acetylenolpyruvoylglucosamine reductase [Candidatus Colwellbacteria bacterium RIFCSPLOWO2_12_FULL_44_13]|uniref:UDP-N-acetylenolpyruvoylglucosamine reductase n=3 Tax=Candidatus Colwelliibacteriota TaxID=1817904 RepID=A0A1G1Z5L9_9BACT|nr:MAG: UDP-N-acetylenolpyruvoylglucosamine reductase [Candidatus Colwellbacteria bacterium RIFCSPHIGHO2_12_FULL_44_17]OGY59912.1 MAG: UDP-N-acetylenolpyruvoylglucosamine reductase [Candidatus Colwellbacteria bacterium RIFCSPLOWO2_02_FULL_44_20b]OGY61773.1 MAG: UDP-N-acetylenolpyruvoylglucosamine reductase [Candidatus Colwellbacteria bacterium RIFCSPLOWO2_12_FULL_44_13]